MAIFVENVTDIFGRTDIFGCTVSCDIICLELFCSVINKF